MNNKFHSLLIIGSLASLLSLNIAVAQGQKTDTPYRELPQPPESYTPGAVAARMLDGLGFRFYWATDNLRTEDLEFKPGEEARTSFETVIHIYEMSEIILNVAKKQPTNFPIAKEANTFPEIRSKALQNIRDAAEIVRNWSEKDFKEHEMIFKSQRGSAEYPYWNLINGPILDCIWHVGQIVTFRRSSGNPFNEKVSVLSGAIP